MKIKYIQFGLLGGLTIAWIIALFFQPMVNANEKEIYTKAIPILEKANKNLAQAQENNRWLLYELVEKRPDDKILFHAFDTIFQQTLITQQALEEGNSSTDAIFDDWDTLSQRTLKTFQNHPLVTKEEVQVVIDRANLIRNFQSKNLTEYNKSLLINYLKTKSIAYTNYFQSKVGGNILICSFGLQPVAKLEVLPLGKPMEIELFLSYPAKAVFYSVDVNNQPLPVKDGVARYEATFQEEGLHRIPVKVYWKEKRLIDRQWKENLNEIRDTFNIYVFDTQQ